MQSTPKPVPHFDAPTWRSLFAQTVPGASGCWEWIGYRDKQGYGVAKVGGSRFRAHRLFYSLLVEALDPALVIDHVCRNTSCVNPMHLEQVTQQINNLRGVSPASINATVAECPAGHPYDAQNTYIHAGRRHCTACNRERQRRARERTHCAKGHDWVAENIYIQPNGTRRCRICMNVQRDRNRRPKSVTT